MTPKHEHATQVDRIENRPTPFAGSSSEESPAANGEGVQQGGGSRRVYGVSPALHSYMRQIHAPLLAKPLVKLLVLAVFVGGAVLSLAAIPHVSRYAYSKQCV